MTGVYLEAGQRRVFACAWEWPGWCRSGRSQQTALAALADAASRFAVVCAKAGQPFDAEACAAELTVIERVQGSPTTDFGALDVAPALDGRHLGPPDAARTAAIVRAAWDVFDEVAATASTVLRKGPRGGGRDTGAIVDHVQQTELLHARMLGLKPPPGSADGCSGAAVRDGLAAAILASGDGQQLASPTAARRPARFVARRIAWHALDHAWEIQDRQGPA